jgi:Zn-finger protein
VNFKGFTNTSCEFYPCHKEVKRDFNCLFCYCPLVNLECPGPYKVFTDKYDRVRKDCMECKLNHDGVEQSWNFIQIWLSNSPTWDTKEQSTEKIKKYSKLVNEKFDRKDIEWAKNL